MTFKEEESITLITKKEVADQLNLDYAFVASWITLTVHSSLEAVGLTAAFSKALSENGISCNVVAAYYHDHIFVDKKDTDKALAILNAFSK
ncbi:ACT domain-containing protein [Winogradskyella sp.]